MYTYTYDEMKIILDGDFQISQSVASSSLTTAEDANGEGEANGSKMTKNGEEVKAEVKEVEAGKGDVFFFPKGAVITFRTRQGGLAWYCGQRGKDAA